MPETKTTTPSLGYYSEHVDETRWPEVSRRMRSVGIKSARAAVNNYRKQCPRWPKREGNAQYVVEFIERRIAPAPTPW